MSSITKHNELCYCANATKRLIECWREFDKRDYYDWEQPMQSVFLGLDMGALDLALLKPNEFKSAWLNLG